MLVYFVFIDVNQPLFTWFVNIFEAISIYEFYSSVCSFVDSCKKSRLLMFYLYCCKSAFTRLIHKYFEETSRYFYVVVVISPMYLLLISIPLLSM